MANPKQRGDHFPTDSISLFERSRAQNMVSAWGFGSRVNQEGVRYVYVDSYIKIKKCPSIWGDICEQSLKQNNV